MTPHDGAGIVAIVLAGGASSRFGSDKLATPIGGRPLLHHALEAVAQVADRLVVVIAPEAPAPPVPEGLAARVVVARDAVPRGGPLAGLAAGLAAGLTAGLTAGLGWGPAGGAAHSRAAGFAPHDTPVGEEAPHIALVVGGDMPWLVPAVLRLLATALKADPTMVAMTLAASGSAPLPMALRAEPARLAADAILASGQRRSLRALLEAIPAAELDSDAWLALDPTGATLWDVDSPADLVSD